MNKEIPETQADPNEHLYFPDGTPIAFDADALQEQHRWKDEELDELIPPNSWLSDWVLGHRDAPTTTSLSLWTGIFVLSSILKRNAHIRWAEGILPPNMFIFLVSEPGVGRKTTCISKAYSVLEGVMDHVKRPEMHVVRKPKIVTGSITPEALIDELAPRYQRVKVPTQVRQFSGDKYLGTKTEERVVQISSGSTMCMIISELSTAIDQKRYNVGLIARLTSLYDGVAGDGRTTLSKKQTVLKNPYITLLGGTTPTEMQSTFPDEAKGGGFVSRTIFVLSSRPTRVYAFPPTWEGLPRIEDLQKRLAWIIDHATGTYEFSPEAKQAHEDWYMDWYEELYTMDSRNQHIYVRHDNQILRLAIIIRASRYEKGNIITLEDWELARELMDATRRTSAGLLNPVPRARSEIQNDLLKYLEQKTREKKPPTRRHLRNWLWQAYQEKTARMDATLEELLRKALVCFITKRHVVHLSPYYARRSADSDHVMAILPEWPDKPTLLYHIQQIFAEARFFNRRDLTRAMNYPRKGNQPDPLPSTRPKRIPRSRINKFTGDTPPMDPPEDQEEEDYSNPM